VGAVKLGRRMVPVLGPVVVVVPVVVPSPVPVSELDREWPRGVPMFAFAFALTPGMPSMYAESA
jgi:uncharacterized membrane protein YadS